MPATLAGFHKQQGLQQASTNPDLQSRYSQHGAAGLMAKENLKEDNEVSLQVFTRTVILNQGGRGGVPPPPAGVPRGAPAPRGVPPSRGPVSRARGLLAPRARGVPLPAGYRPLPPPPAQETYGEYEYDDGYGTAYDEQGYDSYDNSYSTQAQSGTDYYDYGHGLNEETYDSYGQEEWTNSRHKAPSARTTKGIYRDQPYARY
nr:KH domain-containing, RNA-binding, signal transduction-associated protein 3-like [Chelonoidis abingdonii]